MLTKNITDTVFSPTCIKLHTNGSFFPTFGEVFHVDTPIGVKQINSSDEDWGKLVRLGNIPGILKVTGAFDTLFLTLCPLVEWSLIKQAVFHTLSQNVCFSLVPKITAKIGYVKETGSPKVVVIRSSLWLSEGYWEGDLSSCDNVEDELLKKTLNALFYITSGWGSVSYIHVCRHEAVLRFSQYCPNSIGQRAICHSIANAHHWDVDSVLTL